ncbi:hypothetical protein ACL1I8_14505, partial [Corynebacterium striatum]
MKENPLQYRVRGTPVPTTRTRGTNYPKSTDKADNLAIELVKINALVTIECMDDLVCDDFDCGFHIRFIFRS